MSDDRRLLLGDRITAVTADHLACVALVSHLRYALADEALDDLEAAVAWAEEDREIREAARQEVQRSS